MAKRYITRADFLKGMAASLFMLGIGPSRDALASSGAAHGTFNDLIWDTYWTKGDMGKAIDATASKNGAKPTIVSWYNYWGRDSFPRTHLEQIYAKGSQPLLTWEPRKDYADASGTTYSPSRIAAGAHDSYIRSWASAAKSFGKPIYVRIFHEADLRGHGQYPWQLGSTWDVIRAHRRTVDIFRSAGATNVKWVWNPSANPSYSALQAVFPGASYVDCGGFDHYGNPEWNGGWKSFTENVWYPYSHVRYLTGGKPMIVGEFGQIEGQPGWKGEWIRKAMQDEIKAYFPLIRAMVYFDSWEWVLSSSPSALNGYQAGISSPYMQGRL